MEGLLFWSPPPVTGVICSKIIREPPFTVPAPRNRGSSSAVKKIHPLNLEVSPHRAVSAVRLMRIEFGGAFADLLNEKGKGSGDNEMGYVARTLGFRTRDLEDRDLRLVTEIVGGAIRWRRYLDHLIGSLCHDERMFSSTEPLLLQILRIGFYEIVKLDMPSYAVVNESVRLAKVALRPGAGNMVNGILRMLVLLKESDSLPEPKLEGDARAQARVLAILHSHPVWMVRRWTKHLGQEEAIKLMMWNNSDPSFSLRANGSKGFTRADLVAKLALLEVPYELSSHLDDFVRVKKGMQNVIQAGLLKEGLCAVQDESAGLIVSVVDPQPGESIVDCCAAPGGKTLFMASLLCGQGMVSAIDINKGRLRILEETAKLHQVNNVITAINADIRTFADENKMKADKVLLDAPCSGMGVLSKRADLRWNRRLEDMEELYNLQDELLDAASTLVKPGGVLVYSTCSIDPEENEQRVAAFLLRHQEYSIDPVDRYVPPEFVMEHGFYSSNPVKHALDGAFAARLIRSLACSKVRKTPLLSRMKGLIDIISYIVWIRLKTKLEDTKEDECCVASSGENRSEKIATDPSDKKGRMADDPSQGTFSCHELISEFYSDKSSRNTKQIRAEKL